MDGLYDADFVAWTRRQAELLRQTRPNALDWDKLAEEVEDLGKRERRELQENLARVIEHLLKLQYSPSEAPRRGWRVSIVEHRDRVRVALQDSGTLRAELQEIVARAWLSARDIAAAALQQFDGVDPTWLPAELPYGIDQLLDKDWFPPE